MEHEMSPDSETTFLAVGWLVGYMASSDNAVVGKLPNSGT
jgi:hypothetical protein